MRVLVYVVALLGCGDADKDRQIAKLKSQVAELQDQVAAKPPPATLPPPAPSPPVTSDVTYLFVQAVRADPTRMSRASGLKIPDVVNEDGLVVDAEKIATAVRAKTIRMYGKETAQRALIDYFGAEVGNAVFYEKIKNPE